MFFIGSFLIGAIITAILTVLGTIKTSLKVSALISLGIGFAVGPVITYGISSVNTEVSSIQAFNLKLNAIPKFKGQAYCNNDNLYLIGEYEATARIREKPESIQKIPVRLNIQEVRSCDQGYFPTMNATTSRIQAHAEEVVLNANKLIDRDPDMATAVSKLILSTQ